jgi:hypothetical protein
MVIKISRNWIPDGLPVAFIIKYCVLQNDLNIVNERCILYGLKLNVMKSKLLMVSLKKNEIISFSYTINDILIEQVNSHPHLSVFLNENLNFNIQCDKTVKSSAKMGSFKVYV